MVSQDVSIDTTSANGNNGTFDTREVAMEILRRKASEGDFLSFLRYCWWMPQPLAVGRHTRALANRMSKAVKDFEQGKSTYLIVTMPFRHGKSDLMSRAFPAFFLGKCHRFQPGVMLSGYGTSLMEEFSRNIKTIIDQEAYKRVFPGVELAKGDKSVNGWSIEGSRGRVTAMGLGGSLTGKGGAYIDLDDYCRNRADAESKTLRDKTWESFKDDLMTRRSDPAIVAITATRWHIDDLIGRVLKAMGKPGFPQFEVIKFPARKAGEDGWETLFPERYSDEWYTSQRALLGSYSAAALMDCDPVGDATRLFKDSWWNEYQEKPPLQTMNIVIQVDPANSKKESADYTTVWVKGFALDGNVYILDCIHDKLNLKERTECVFELHKRYKPLCVAYESYGLDGDIQHIELEQERLHYRFHIVRLKHRMNKEQRIMRLQPWFEQGKYWFPLNIYHKRSDGSIYDAIQDFKDNEFECYPAGAHDDMLDALSDDFDDELKDFCRFPETAEQKAEKERFAPIRNNYINNKNIFGDVY